MIYLKITYTFLRLNTAKYAKKIEVKIFTSTKLKIKIYQFKFSTT